MLSWTKIEAGQAVTGTLDGKLVELTSLAPAVTGNGHAGNGGIQSHSLGDTYPLGVYGVGPDWRVWNPETGDEFASSLDCGDAWEHCRWLSKLAQAEVDRVECNELRFASRVDIAAEAVTA